MAYENLLSMVPTLVVQRSCEGFARRMVTIATAPTALFFKNHSDLLEGHCSSRQLEKRALDLFSVTTTLRYTAVAEARFANALRD